MSKKSISTAQLAILAVLASNLVAPTVHAQSVQDADKPAASASQLASTATSATHSPRHANRFPKRAEQYYSLVWGVDSLEVKYAESGEVIRFSYRVLNAAKAKALNDKQNEPSLIDARAGVKLVVPSLEKVGKLRQSSTPESGKSYWMAFSNKGRYVKRGDRVIVVIGQFRADGLIVD